MYIVSMFQIYTRLNSSIISINFCLQSLWVSDRLFFLSNLIFKTVLKSPPTIIVFSSFSFKKFANISKQKVSSVLGPLIFKITNSFSFIIILRSCILPANISLYCCIVYAKFEFIKIAVPSLLFHSTKIRIISPFRFPYVVCPVPRMSFLQ